MERDVETGNDHAWFRNYEQNLGRWMSPDPLGGDITNPQSLNRYAYAMNNPASLTDPLGLCVSGGTGPCGWVYYPADVGCELFGWECAGGGGEAVFGNDIFDVIGGTAGFWDTGNGMWGAGAFSLYNTPTGLGFSFDPGSSALSPFGYYFVGTVGGQYYSIYNPKWFNTFDEYADWRTSNWIPQDDPGYLAAAQAQYDYVVALLQGMPGVTQAKLDIFQELNSDLAGLEVEGGNVNFNNVLGTDEDGNLVLLFNFGCDNGRCDNGLDFSHNAGASFHADTANPYNGVASAVVHFAVDVFGGNYVWGVIPRH
jgi:RHS repeat-associated protein